MSEVLSDVYRKTAITATGLASASEEVARFECWMRVDEDWDGSGYPRFEWEAAIRLMDLFNASAATHGSAMIYDGAWDRFVVTSTDQADPEVFETFGAERIMTKEGPVTVYGIGAMGWI